MDASQLQYLEIVHSGPKHNYCLFDVPKVREMLWNTPKHHFGSNVVEWMLHNFDVLQQWIQAQNTCFTSFYVRRLEKWSKTLPNIILGQPE
jgi:protein associated with RNAse G/E